MTENPNPIIIIEIEYIANDERFEPIMEKSRSDCMAREEPPQAESGSHCVFLETTLRRFPAERANPVIRQ